MKSLFAWIALVGFAQTALAQEITQASLEDQQVDNISEGTAPPSQLLLKIGPGWSSISSYNNLDADSNRRRTSIFVGIDFERPITADFSVVSGVSFFQKGMDNLAQGAATDLNYLEIPFLAKFNFNVSPRGMLSMTLGPYIAHAIWKSQYVVQGGITTQYATDDISSFDYGARFGLDYELTIKSGLNFLVGAGYDLGLANLTPTTIYSQSTRALFTNIGLGVKL